MVSFLCWQVLKKNLLKVSPNFTPRNQFGLVKQMKVSLFVRQNEAISHRIMINDEILLNNSHEHKSPKRMSPLC